MDKNILLVPATIKKNTITVVNQWDANDADYETEMFEIDPEKFFNNDKLIYVLAYVTTPYNFKGHGWNESKFSHHVTENEDIDDILDILDDADFLIRTEYTDYEPCHSVVDIDMTYYDEDGTPFAISFSNIRKAWENMTYEEICNFINNIPRK